jgi:hypothetical protein
MSVPEDISQPEPKDGTEPQLDFDDGSHGVPTWEQIKEAIRTARQCHYELPETKAVPRAQREPTQWDGMTTYSSRSLPNSRLGDPRLIMMTITQMTAIVNQIQMLFVFITPLPAGSSHCLPRKPPIGNTTECQPTCDESSPPIGLEHRLRALWLVSLRHLMTIQREWE